MLSSPKRAGSVGLTRPGEVGQQADSDGEDVVLFHGRSVVSDFGWAIARRASQCRRADLLGGEGEEGHWKSAICGLRRLTQISDAFPAGGKISYYFSVELQKGDLLTQISFEGRSGAGKQVELALLGANARVADSYWIHGSDAKEEATRSFPIDSSGRRVLRVTVQGPETGGFRLELGGSAFVAPETPSAQGPLSSHPRFQMIGRVRRFDPLEFRQLMPEPGELTFGVVAGVGCADCRRLVQ